MRILITGATGFIGKYLSRHLAKKGFQIKCLLRTSSNVDRVGLANIEYFVSDLNDPARLETYVQDCDVVFHLAGSVYEHRWKTLYQSNCVATQNLYKAIRKTSVRRFIYLSSIAAVSPRRNNMVIDENCPPRPISNYGRSKLIAEKIIENLHSEKDKITTIIIRAPMIYGVGFNPNSRLAILIQKLRDGTFCFIGKGKNIISLCHIINLIGFLELVLTVPQVEGGLERVNICDDEHLTFYEIVKIICEFLDINKDFPSFPIFIGKTFGVLGDIRRLISRKENLLTSERIAEILGHWNMSNSKAKSWGYRQIISLEKGLQDTLETYRNKV